MVLFNYSTKELTAKIVYYGPGLCGKTTNLQFIHKNLGETVKGKMLSLATKTDRTLFFDFLPMDLGEIRGMKTRMQLYTVPGQVFYNETRKLVLKGVDGIVFVADSQQEMLAPNAESFRNLEENLKTHGLSLAELPHVIQFNKRDLPKLASIEEMNASVNKHNAPFYESVATTGIGVQDTLKAITKLVLLNLTKKYDPRTATAPQPAASPRPAARPSIPLAAAPAATVSAVATEAPKKRAAAPPIPPVTVPSFPADEIDDLVDEVQESTVEMAGLEAHAAGQGNGKSIRVEVEAVPHSAASVKLTDIATDGDLFEDPSLEIAHLVDGQTREIVIPVQVGEGSSALRRYKLSLKLRLDSID